MEENKSPDIIAKAVQWVVLVGIPLAVGFAIRMNVEVAVLKESNTARAREVENINREMKELNNNVQSIKEKVIVIENNNK